MATGLQASVPDRPVRARIRTWRALAIGVSGGVSLLLTVLATYGQVAARSNPAAAKWSWPIAAEPRARLAEARFTAGGTPAEIRAFRAEAQQVLLRDPLNVVAARTAGMFAGLTGDEAGARRLLNYAQSLSRRDLSTQLALIEFSVADDDVQKALTHYDIALRTSDAADQLLMPVLVEAARDPHVAAALRPMLAAQPPWRLRFVYSLITARPWSANFIPLLLSARLSVDAPQEQDFLRRSIQGLVADNAIADAARVYSVATKTKPAPGVRNGAFRDSDRLPPFDWDLLDAPGFAALKGSVEGAPTGTVLSLMSDGSRREVVAKQLLLLPAGAYAVRFRAGAIPANPDAAPIVQIICHKQADRVLSNIPVPAASMSGAQVSAKLIVPRDCPVQFLTITTGMGETTDSAQPWLGWFSVKPA